MASLSNPFDVLTGLGAPAAKGGMAFQNPVSTIGPSGVTSGFGHRSSPMGIGSRNHGGIDLAARGAGGGYAAEAAAGGTVTFAGRAGGYGNMVEVTHADGSKTRYGHLQSLNVNVGDQVAAGTPVGKVGSTGKSTGPHLHFEVIDKNGQKVNPKSVTDLANRSLSVTPTPRPSDDIGALMAFDAGPVPPSFTAPDPSRFGPAQISPAASLASISRPSPNIDPARFGPVDISPAASVASFSQPSAERFGYAPEAKSGSLGGLGGMSAKAAIDPDRFGPAQMTSTPTTGRLSSTVNASNSTPMAASLSPVGIGPQSLSSPVQRAAEDAGYLTTHVNTTSVAPTAMGLLPSTAQAPVGSFSTFNPMPTDLNVLDKALNRLPTNPPLSLPNMPAIPSVVPPTVAPMVTPTVTKQPVSPQTTASVRPSQPPMATAADVYAGRATTGVASNGATVSRDPVTGNISVTNQFGATTVTDPSGRQMGNLSGIGKGIGNAFDKAMDHVTPGMIGSVVGGAIAGMPGAIVGGLVGNKMGGQQSGQKSGGLGGLGGFLSGLFGGGNSGNGGGGSSGSRGGGSSGSRGGPAGADRDHAGNG
jgi:murein DD-endopeptidase MepM/ murein hydrolase activator NlpD